jgi:hypothetical protein
MTKFYSILRKKSLLFLIIHLLRNVTCDTKQIHHIYFMKNRVFGIKITFTIFKNP